MDLKTEFNCKQEQFLHEISESKQVKMKSVVAIFLLSLNQDWCDVDNKETILKVFEMSISV